MAVFLCRAAVPLGWMALLAFGVVILLPALRAAPLGRALAWLSALLVVSWLAAHLTVRLHEDHKLPRDLQRELRFRLLAPGRARDHRARGRRAAQGWYGGRSRSGERPRFD